MLWTLYESNMGTAILLALFIYLGKQIYNNMKQRKKLPPGPMGLPIVGYMPFLGKDPHKDIAKLSETYGNIFTLQMGIHNVVILNDWESVRDALLKDSFLGKPSYSPFTVATGEKSFSDENGVVWKEQRRLALQILRDLGFGKGLMEDRVQQEISYLLRELDKTNGNTVNFSSLLTPSMSNVICLLVFGHRMDYNNPQRIMLDKALNGGSGLFSQIGILALSPEWLGRMIFKIGAIGRSNLITPVTRLFEDEVSTHIKNLNENNTKDYIDKFLIEMEARKKSDTKTSLDLNMLKANCRLFFGAGSNTVRITIEWNVLLCAKYQNYQQRIQSEIDSVIGNRSVMWEDRLRMPFTQAFMMEAFRLKPVIPLNLMRRSVEESSILGRFIPKDTWILANIWSVHNDPKVWENPELFNPFRFLSDDEKYVIKCESLMPFSIGKRSCAGETLARVELFLYFTSLLQRYRVINSDDNKIITLEESFGLALEPKDRVLLRFQARNAN